jgi:hypothetical protein
MLAHAFVYVWVLGFSITTGVDSGIPNYSRVRSLGIE